MTALPQTSAVRRAARELSALSRLLWLTIFWTFRGKRERGSVARQMYAMGNQSLFFMTVTMGFIGAILIFQSATQVKRVVPDMSMLGATYLKFLVRDLAASIGAMPLATRIGAAMAAEIGSMVVTDQVDAMRMCAAEPVDYLVVPRFIASVVMSTVILIWSAAVAFAAGMFTADVLFDVNPRTFASMEQLHAGDVALGVTKCLTYGAAIAIVSTHQGLSAYGGSEGVGRATTNAVVGSCLAIIVLNFFISSAGYALLPP